jgi:hypothetical protein
MLDFFADGEMQVAFDTDHGEAEDREISLFGVTFQVKQERGSMPISQDSMIVGNTLWNSSIVLARYIESGAEGTFVSCAVCFQVACKISLSLSLSLSHTHTYTHTRTHTHTHTQVQRAPLTNFRHRLSKGSGPLSLGPGVRV